MYFAEFPFLRYAIFFISGILIYPIWKPEWNIEVIWLLAIVWLLYLAFLWIDTFWKKNLFKHLLPAMAYLQLILAGFLFSEWNDFSKLPNHITQHDDQIDYYLAEVMDFDEKKPNSIANKLSIKQVFADKQIRANEGQVIIYHRMDTLLEPGNIVLVKGQPDLIPKPANPQEFDYKRFMQRQQVSHRHFVGQNMEVLGKVEKPSLQVYFHKLRREIEEKMQGLFQDQKAFQVGKALLLGQKKDLDKDLQEAYASAGAMHVLAVSGLHVGIIYGFFFLFFKPYRMKTIKRILYLLGIIVIIWCYAMFTGMSPSVMRAATMFSFVALAQMKSRSPSIFNPLALSAIVLLVLNPNLIYAVGFQLSYVALSGILIIQPILVRWWLPPNRLLEYFWQITTVGIAAQLATFPLSAFYFHIFPTYFMLSNLVAIPAAFLIMSVGLPMMIFSGIDFLAKPLAFLTEQILIAFNQLVWQIQQLPMAKLTDIYFSGWTVALYWLFLALLIMLLIAPKKSLIYALTVYLIIIGVFRVYWAYQDYRENHILLYAVPKGFALDVKSGKSLWFFDRTDEGTLSYNVLSNRSASGAKWSGELTSFESRSQTHFLLPNDLGLLTLDGDSLKLPEKLKEKQVYYWDGEDWKKQDYADVLLFGQSAIKIPF